MTDTDTASPCHPDTTLYADRYGYLTCACGQVYQPAAGPHRKEPSR